MLPAKGNEARLVVFKCDATLRLTPVVLRFFA
jgi:hypothetical protein